MRSGSPVISEWLTPPEDLSLARNEIHVWRCFLNLPPQQIESLEETLSDDEIKRAERFSY